jgi:Dpy-30 motif
VILEPISIYNTKRINEYLCNVIYQPLTDALYEMTKVKPDDPLEWLAKFMLCNNNNKPLIHATNPQAMRQMMELREIEEREKNHKPTDDSVPAKCGCYLSKSSSNVSSTSTTVSRQY